MRDDAAEIIAGVNGFVIYGAIYTDQFWIDKDYREQGFAKKIMNKVHEFGKLEGCKIATVQTMSFQGAQIFYEKKIMRQLNTLRWRNLSNLKYIEQFNIKHKQNLKVNIYEKENTDRR